jgi:hypothetical protein
MLIWSLVLIVPVNSLFHLQIPPEEVIANSPFRPGSKSHKKELVEAVTIIETPPVRRTMQPAWLVPMANIFIGDRCWSSWLH